MYFTERCNGTSFRLSFTGDPVPDPSFAALAWLLPAVLAGASLLARLRPATAWRSGERALLATPLLALLAFPALTATERVMALLVTVIGAITLRFSRRYLDGERDRARYVHWFLLAVTGAALVVVAQDLVVMGLAWTLTSLSLHQLLLFGPARAAAEVAAHKKFLLSRVADLFVAAALTCIALAYGSSDLREILPLAADARVNGLAAAGVALLAFAIVLRSAQLPFHGWLIQVMEAPTPVSALLHAGIVNLGAFVAIKLAGLFVAAPVALALLLGFGLFSATLAALTMRTRGSVKSALAWSTCAQMGFVLVEIGLGAFDLALLHILAHAAYKAQAFLASGSGVATVALRAPAPSAPGLGHWLLAATVAIAGVTALALTLWTTLESAASHIASAAVLALALIPTLAQAFATPTRRDLRAALGIVLGLPMLYTLWLLLLPRAVPAVSSTTLPALAVAITIAVFTAALGIQAAIAIRPQGRLAQRLYPHANAGFHLDALFTRLTFRLWPPTITPPAMQQRRERSPLRLERAA